MVNDAKTTFLKNLILEALNTMYSFISRFSDTNEINYCPKCGKPVGCGFADETCECNIKFGVIVTEDKNDTGNDSKS